MTSQKPTQGDKTSPTTLISPTTHPLAKFKQRSHDINHGIHIPSLTTASNSTCANLELKAVLDSLDESDRKRIVWVEARHSIAKEMLVDYVHLNENG